MRNKGITLIALVITIIVLLILVGVSIATLTGDNGILTKATTAKEKTVEEGEKEQIKLAYNAVLAEKRENTDNLDITKEELQKELDNLASDETTVSEGTGNSLKIEFHKTEHIYKVNSNGINLVDKNDDGKIHFTIDGVGYEYPEGWTWQDLMNSDNNPLNLYNFRGWIAKYDSESDVEYMLYDAVPGSYIEDNGVYHLDEDKLW